MISINERQVGLMADKSDWIVDGFQFGTKNDAEQAKNELLRIERLEGQLNYRDLEVVEAVYNKAIETRVFKTPVGYVFMKKLQRVLKKEKDSENLLNIPVLSVSNFREETSLVQEKIKASRKPVKSKPTRKELSVKLLLGVNAVLILLIAAMFYITINGSNPNIINYERVLQNKYSQWDQELTQREAVIREKERELLME